MILIKIRLRVSSAPRQRVWAYIASLAHAPGLTDARKNARRFPTIREAVMQAKQRFPWLTAEDIEIEEVKR